MSRVAFATIRLVIVTLVVSLVQASALAGDQKMVVVDYTYTADPFQITNENVSRVRSVDYSDANVQFFTVVQGACRGRVIGDGKLQIRVHGAVPHAFRVGQLIATGDATIGKKSGPAVRAITAEDIRALGCPTH
jgi:hypothetical protein